MNPEEDHSFLRLKQAFCSATVLQQPNPELLFEVEVSDAGVRAVLFQRSPIKGRRHPCAFLSKNLMLAERNYDVGNQELIAIKQALEEWRLWLEGARHPSQVYTNHRNLEYLQKAKRLNPCQAR